MILEIPGKEKNKKNSQKGNSQNSQKKENSRKLNFLKEKNSKKNLKFQNLYQKLMNLKKNLLELNSQN